MNQEKTGRFIARLRKEKNMTQNDLAKKLGITDRAVSKWENGRGMPDISLLMPLCELLDISINELLSGERLDKEAYEERFEENIIGTIDYTDKRLKKTKKLFAVILLTVFLVFSALVTMFCIDVGRMRNNEPVIFSTWGYCYTPAVDMHENEIEAAITDYFIQEGDSEPKHHSGEKTFVSMRIYLTEEKERNGHYEIYAWVLKQKYYEEKGEIKKDSGTSSPFKLTVKSIDGKFTVTDSEAPRDGSYYPADMKTIFPLSVRNDMDKAHTDGIVEELHSDIERQVRLYFHK